MASVKWRAASSNRPAENAALPLAFASSAMAATRADPIGSRADRVPEASRRLGG
uniref:Uncharacterized protein n=1 Tax=Arundo donax TaxID=35708 RepID=A0A0A9A8K0_ARUDO